MANIIERAADYLAERIAYYITPQREKEMKRAQDYYEGEQVTQLKVKAGQYDDNAITNLVSLGVDRSTAMLFGGGVEFTVPEGSEDAKQLYLDNTWEANKKNILLNKWGTDGELWGTSYIKMIPEGATLNDEPYTRLVLQDPKLMAMQCDPMDADNVLKYIFEVKIDDIIYREVVRRSGAGEPENTWIITKYKTERGGVFKQDGEPVVWGFDFPPILHVQNMPGVHSVYGRSGIKGVDKLQDKYNFVMSNMLKIIRYHANPKPFIIGAMAAAIKKVLGTGPDEAIVIEDKGATVGAVEMNSDLASSRNVAHDIKQSIFESMRVVDTGAIASSAGNLTQFVLRAIYADALAKNSVRRLLYGDAIKELNRRLLIINDMEPSNDVVWGSDMPSDEKEDAALILQDLAAGIVSKETASEERGYQWKSTVNEAGIPISGEEDKIATEAASNANAGNLALARLLSGQDVPQ